MNVFQDSDGCLVDFDKQVFNFFGKTPRDFQGDDLMWAAIKEQADDFWATMPLKFGALELWEAVLPYNPTILTGAPKCHFEQASAHKIAKAKFYFGDDVKIITCLSRNKPLHMTAPGDILIDDFTSNTKRWVKAGGRAVHYRRWDQAITDFKKLVETPYVPETP